MPYNFFAENKEDLYKIINKKVLGGSYEFTPYKEKLILKSRNSYPRIISIPTLRDKLVLKGLQLVLSKTFNEIRQPLPQECIEEIKNNIHQYNHFIKLDISNFYGTIKHGILFDKLKKKIKKVELLNLIEKALTTHTVKVGESRSQDIITQGVPQGLSISNILAHIYLNELDVKFKNRSNIKYIRYVDDIIILCSDKNINSTYKEMKYELEGIYNLSINDKKEKLGNITKDGFEFLGYAVKDFGAGYPKLTVREENKRRFEDSIVKIFTKYKHSKKMSPQQFLFILNNKITGSVSQKVSGDETKEFKYGWLFYFSQMEDTGFLYHLDWFVRQLLIKFKFYHIDQNKIKTFVKAFYEIKYNVRNSNYIHRPDTLTFEQRKSLLVETFKIPEYHLYNTNTVDKYYRKLVYKPILEYEKDIKSIVS